MSPLPVEHTTQAAHEISLPVKSTMVLTPASSYLEAKRLLKLLKDDSNLLSSSVDLDIVPVVDSHQSMHLIGTVRIAELEDTLQLLYNKYNYRSRSRSRSRSHDGSSTRGAYDFEFQVEIDIDTPPLPTTTTTTTTTATTSDKINAFLDRPIRFGSFTTGVLSPFGAWHGMQHSKSSSDVVVGAIGINTPPLPTPSIAVNHNHNNYSNYNNDFNTSSDDDDDDDSDTLLESSSSTTSLLPIDTAPFIVSCSMPLSQLNYIFRALKISHAFLIEDGRLVSFISRASLRKYIMSIEIKPLNRLGLLGSAFINMMCGRGSGSGSSSGSSSGGSGGSSINLDNVIKNQNEDVNHRYYNNNNNINININNNNNINNKNDSSSRSSSSSSRGRIDNGRNRSKSSYHNYADRDASPLLISDPESDEDEATTTTTTANTTTTTTTHGNNNNNINNNNNYGSFLY